MKIKFEWEKISENSFHQTCRTKVFGGWIVNNTSFVQEDTSLAESAIFIKDPQYEWEVE